ncbi:glycine betaine/proline transport system ATP-binding protein [Rhodopseudomonas julia]|uniref:Glycine betaine/proline transport system ATP-binding protein n=1 Tax=Rhodopseudomonas julia TaxID=200617 RepID=A0ABU0C837_9BRAD|nr:choline ABC transporter ATP-binding protein [Rhodopseudomonas julia]MDQ0326091.1 glycine betaine/proline transport system ATP-binding protein [Rhodopseudomonas julia]
MSATSSRQPVVRFKGVDIVFGDNPAKALPLIDAGKSRAEIQDETNQIVGVKNADLDVYDGEVVVLMGLSGSGKSTLLRAVNGLNPVTRGEVFVHDGESDVPVHSCGTRQLRKLRRNRVSMVFQQFALLPWRTVRENVALGLELSHVGRRRRRKDVERQLELVGLGGWGDKRVEELSGGMQQRVGLARALANDAPILLMDEPFSALDPLIRDRLQDELLDLQRRLERTIIFVSHDLDEALKLGNRIAIMEGGIIVQVGTPQEIVLSPASEYVRAFVSHMNPLNVLRAQEVMRPVHTNGGGATAAGERAGGDSFELVSDGIVRNGETLPLIELQNLRSGSLAPGSLVRVGRETGLRDLIDARLMHRGDFIVVGDDGVKGVIGDEELFGALIRGRSELQAR